MRNPSAIVSVAAVIALGLAACGGSDSGPIDVGAPADVATDLPGAVQEAIESGDLGALENLADLDLGELQNLTADDLANLTEDDLQGMLEGMDDMISRMGGDGTATITVGEVTYAVAADVCFALPREFTLDGPATGSDGSNAWASVNYSLSTREDLAEVLDESMIEFMFPEGSDVLEDVSVEVNVGQTSRFASVEDQPSWHAVAGTMWGSADLEYTYSGGTVRGSGQAEDYNFGGGTAPSSSPISFEASCS